VHLHAPIGLKAIQEKIQLSDFCLLFAAQDHSFAFNTKFYEYLANRKPIVIFSKSGEVPDFLVKNSLGVAIDYEKFEANFVDFLNSLKSKAFQFNNTFNTDQFSTETHANTVRKLLI
jgi:hypothetical protein